MQHEVHGERQDTTVLARMCWLRVILSGGCLKEDFIRDLEVVLLVYRLFQSVHTLGNLSNRIVNVRIIRKLRLCNAYYSSLHNCRETGSNAFPNANT